MIDEHHRPPRSEGPDPVVDDAHGTLQALGRPPLRGTSRQRTRSGRSTRLTPRLSKALVKLIPRPGGSSPRRRCGVPHQTVCDWIARGEGRHREGRRACSP
jgi:hypothetical protein